MLLSNINLDHNNLNHPIPKVIGEHQKSGVERVDAILGFFQTCQW